MLEFNEKTAIVTGAASGIGRASARLYAREGAKVAVSDVDEHSGLETVRYRFDFKHAGLSSSDRPSGKSRGGC
jgi:NAD(P)-dependent dehydrogenase (short-subunit alcohol dehydrogenase family)